MVVFVRRAKARSSSGGQTRPATVAPAGSNRSSRGGNEAAEAFDAEGRVGDSTSWQAITWVNAEQVPKITDAEADPIKISGKAATAGEASDERTRPIRRDIGDGMSAQEDRCNTGSPLPWMGRTSNQTPARARLGGTGWRRGPQYRGSRV